MRQILYMVYNINKIENKLEGKMKLSKILDQIDYIDYKENNDLDIAGISSDSRTVSKGEIFVAIDGLEFDGHKFIDMAIENGANTVVITKDVDENPNVNYIKVKDSRECMADISNIINDFPSKKLNVIGVTGTNGKTTTASMASFLLKKLDSDCTNIGTNGSFVGEEKYHTPNTTPEIYDVNKILKLTVDRGIRNAVVECSSHGLYLNRIRGIDFDVAVFTNLSIEHMDFHKTMDNYFDAKMILFENSKKRVTNADDEYGRKAKERYQDAVTFSIENDSDYKAMNIELVDNVTYFEVNGVKFVLNRFARFDVYNALGAIAAVNQLGYSLEDISDALKEFSGVESRFEFMKNSLGINIVVDFAHTTKAFEDLYKTLPTDRKITAVYGISGDRTKEIRQELGRISAKYNVFSVITLDDPKFDTYENISSDIASGVIENNGKFIKIKDRKSAIKYAIENSNKGDFVLLLGKGQEDFLKFEANIKTYYSEKETLNEVLKELNGLD